MARTKISEFSATPANNTDIDSINIAEGCAPSGINDAIRELMAQLKDFQTGAVGDSFNGPIGTSTAAAGAFTTLSATGAITSTLATGTAPLVIASTTKVANLNVDLLDGADWASPAALGSTTPAAGSFTTLGASSTATLNTLVSSGATLTGGTINGMTIGATTASTGAFTTLSASSTVTLSGGTANGVAYLNGSKVVTSGSALTFDGTNLGVGGAATSFGAGYPTLTMVATSGAGIFQSKNTAGDARLYANTDGDAYLGSWANTSLKIYTNSTVKATFDTAGNLGLGVTPSAWSSSSARAIQIGDNNGSISSFTTGETGSNFLFLNNNAYYSTTWKYIQASIATAQYAIANGEHRFLNASGGSADATITFTQAMTLDASGNLGVGTTSPSDTLGYGKAIDIQGTAGSALYLRSATNSSSVYGVFSYDTSAVRVNIGAIGTNNYIRFLTASSERMVLDASGNLGIGTSSPALKLDVAGAVGFGRFTSTTGTNHSGIEVKNGSSYLDFAIDNSTGSQYGFGAYGRGIYSDGAYPFIFNVNGANRLTIDSSGNLGLGVTPSAWYSPFKAIDIATAGAVSGSANGAILWANSFINASASERYKTNGFAVKYVAASDIGAHIWQTAPSGTAGNAITFTQAMTLDASGNLAIGTTSASSRLHLANAGDVNVRTQNTTAGTVSLYGSDSTGTYAGSFSNHPVLFYTNSTERARITSDGDLLLGLTADTFQPSKGVAIDSTNSSRIAIGHANGTASGDYYCSFAYNGGVIGSISQSGTTAVLFNTTSDQRLKENIADADSASTLIDALQVRKFDWKADGSHQRYGFVAQELVTVAPEAVHQPEDTEQMMAVDYSKLVPMLVKEIQSLRKRLADAGL